MAACQEDDLGTCFLLEQLADLYRANQRDGKAAMALLDKLFSIAQTGRPLECFYDKRQCHPCHTFDYGGKSRVVWRIRKASVRLYFYYSDGQVLFLPALQAKRRDKLTRGEKQRLERSVKAFIDAKRDDTLRHVEARRG